MKHIFFEQSYKSKNKPSLENKFCYETSLKDHDLIRDAAIDYHRVNLRDPVDEILARFLVGRKPKKK